MTPYAVAIILRGSYVSPFLLAIELYKREWYGHGAILFSDGRLVEASAWENKVVVRYHPCEWYHYEEVLDLSHLGLPAQQRIAELALSMQGWKYDWRALKSQAMENICSYNEEDSRRVICYEAVTLATKEFLQYFTDYHLVDSKEIIDSWNRSLHSAAG